NRVTGDCRCVGGGEGGWSAVFLVERAGVLRARGNAMRIELVSLDGEEARLWDWQGTDNTYGSRHYVDAARKDGSLATLKAMILIDMIGDRDLDIRRDANSTPWLTDIIWHAAKKQELDSYFLAQATRIEDAHLPFVTAGIPSVDIIDLDYEQWHTAKDTLDACSARSLQVVGDTLLAALPTIEARLTHDAQVIARKTGMVR